MSAYPIYSMTAFGRSHGQVSTEYGISQFQWEIRSVNQRYLEMNFRIADNMRYLEMDVRERIKQKIARGKMDISLSIKTEQALNIQLNQPLLEQLTLAISEVQMHLPEATHVNPLQILQWPGVVQNDAQQSDDEVLHQALMQSLDEAIDKLLESRLREGQALAAVIEQRCEGIEQILAELKPIMPEVVHSHCERFRQRLINLQAQIDEQRYHQEVALLAQKVDVDEELDRLAMHLKEVRHVLSSGQPVGRRLDFLMQELNREANTLGSKSVDPRISQASVELKVLIEQMREQVQNIE